MYYSSTVKKLRKDARKQREGFVTARKTVGLSTTSNLEAAIKRTKEKVETIIKECKETNRKFRDIEFDLCRDYDICLYSDNSKEYSMTGSKRVSQIFENPKFFTSSTGYNDIKQGGISNCWFVAALAVISNIDGSDSWLQKLLHVAYNEQVGVYGFIFFKNGDWVSTVVDDQLFINGVDETRRPKLAFSSKSNETWVSLIEKAYAKVHGDYESIDGGITGQAIEDLTGGVYTLTYTADILDTEKFWEDELSKVNKDVLFACYRWDDGTLLEPKGLVNGHAYSIHRVGEYEGEKLLYIRNPWGNTEWKGPWCDGSREWTPKSIDVLKHKFEQDGTFWMSYKDFLKQWTIIDKCRLFDKSWNVYSFWINYNVEPKSNGKFILTIPEDSFIIIVLQQRDDRLFSSSKFRYQLSFCVNEQGSGAYVTKSHNTVKMAPRSINLECRLRAGTYEIVPRINREDVEAEKKKEENKEEEKEKERDKGEVEKMKERRIRNLTVGKDANDANDESDIEEEKSDEKKKNELWELLLGLRIYSQNKKLTLDGEEGEYPKKEEEEKK